MLMRVWQFLVRLWQRLFKREVPAPVAPTVTPPYSPAIIEKYAWKPGQGHYPGLSGNAHQRRTTRRAQGG
jgi:hypothetical protein